MENQHRQIKGYRELNADEIALMNEIKTKAAEVGDLVLRLQHRAAIEGPGFVETGRWVSIGKTQLQQGFMALTRAVAKPDFF